MAHQFAQHVSAVGALGGALDGTPAKRKRPAAKKADPNSSVSTAVRCECGDQFDDFRAAWLHVYQGHCAVMTNVGELRRADGRRLVALCGTPGGHARHRRNGEPLCDACRSAEREGSRERQRAFRERWKVDPEVRDPYRETLRERNRDLSRARMRAYRARKKAEQMVTVDAR